MSFFKLQDQKFKEKVKRKLELLNILSIYHNKQLCANVKCLQTCGQMHADTV